MSDAWWGLYVLSMIVFVAVPLFIGMVFQRAFLEYESPQLRIIGLTLCFSLLMGAAVDPSLQAVIAAVVLIPGFLLSAAFYVFKKPYALEQWVSRSSFGAVSFYEIRGHDVTGEAGSRAWLTTAIACLAAYAFCATIPASELGAPRILNPFRDWTKDRSFLGAYEMTQPDFFGPGSPIKYRMEIAPQPNHGAVNIRFTAVREKPNPEVLNEATEYANLKWDDRRTRWETRFGPGTLALAPVPGGLVVRGVFMGQYTYGLGGEWKKVGEGASSAP